MRSRAETYDVVVAGGGIAGMVAAAAFGRMDFKTLCVDPAMPPTGRDADVADLRSTALLQPSKAFLGRLGLWDRLSDDASSLRIMRIVEAGGAANAPRLIRDFDAAELGDQPFGWNLPNTVLRRKLAAALSAQPGVTHRTGVAVDRSLSRLGEVRLALSDGSSVSTRLLIGADGRTSLVRQSAGIGVRTTRYAQKALAFAVSHPEPHENVSTEIHRSGGPFTLVPLPDRDGHPASAIVWMERGPEAQRLLALPEADFEAAITERSCSVLGPLRLISRRTIWPIISQIADRFDGERVALVAEAAHVLPPIGAQGLNISLADIRTLADLVADAPDEMGGAAQLAQFNRSRRPEVLARIAGVDALNRASMAEAPALRDMRMRTFEALYALPPLRRGLMKTGLGTRF